MNTSENAAPDTGHAALPAGEHPRALALVLAALVVVMANSTAASPLYRLFQVQLGFDATTLTVIYAVYSAGVLITLLTLGRLSDAVPDRRYLMVPALVAVFGGAIWIAAAHSVFGLVAGRLLSGIGTGALTGAASAALIDLSPPAARHRTAMLSTTAITAGAALGPALSAFALATGFAPTHLPFVVTAAGSLACAFALVKVRWPAHSLTAQIDHAQAHSGSAVPLLTLLGKPFFLASAALALGWAAGAFAMTMAPTIAEQMLGIHDRAIIALLLCVLQLVAGAAQLLSRHLAPRTALCGGIALAAFSLPVCALASWLHMPVVFSLAILVIGVGYGASFVGTAGMVNDVAPSHRRAGAASLFYVVGYAGSALPILAYGALTDVFGMLAATILFAVTGVSVAVAVLWQMFVLTDEERTTV